ncbi:LCP family protein [Aeromicrobium chenweiae]|uniref:LytR family transcriptional regulator n=1 Tax=Aeromicrobium chenweiae TaxID=2079793 RepID=A0A2S0WJI2_9ACTN|nr:LCP family protein [Aeromicrobium chenweiae]AWB91442.1 LytR family transcriptional regulator [Aeromicrobium chenweiae]TGN30627.1 LytR family transcriptional regulator [Aeromicrobium chenweiae]
MLKPARRRRRRHRLLRRALLGLAICLLTPVLLSLVVALYLQHQLAGQIERIDGVFGGNHDRPAKTVVATRAVNILLLGTDRRSDEPTTGTAATAASWVAGAQRSDAIMVLHIDGDRRGASVISIPRDSWVTIPGHGPGKINAAFSYGGPSLAVRTIENVTGIRIDHLAVVDRNGFRELTDSLGGVTLDVPETVHDSYRDVTWTAGRHTMSGDEALDYVGQRAGLPGGDFDRIHRQQHFLRTVLDETLTQELVKEPRHAYRVLDILTKNLSVDSDWSVGQMRGLLVSLRHLRSAGIGYLTVPVAGTGMEGSQSVVHLDRAGNEELWNAVRDDTVSDWLATNPASETPAAVG